jgi:L-threonylcarbamoyladenylate synthase
VLSTLDGRIDAVVDNGPCPIGIESTVVKIDSEKVELLRPGAITRTELEKCLLDTIENGAHRHQSQPLSPGQAYLHYSPAVREVEISSQGSASLQWNSDAIFLGRKKDILALEKVYGPRASFAVTIVLDDSPEFFAQELYSAFYACEEAKEKSLIIILPDDHEDWRAVNDRLRRAASPRHSGTARK